MAGLSPRRTDDGLDPIIPISIALIVLTGFIGTAIYMCYCRPAQSGQQQDQSIPLQNMNPNRTGEEILVNPPLRTGPRVHVPPEPDTAGNRRGRTVVRMHGAAEPQVAGNSRGRTALRMHGAA